MVEDEPLLASTLVEVLIDEGYEVEQVGDATAAEAAVLAGRFDLILLDHTLPGAVTGLALLERWRRAGRQEVVVLTSGDPQVGGQVGENQSFLAKPFSFQELLSLLAGLVAPLSE